MSETITAEWLSNPALQRLLAVLSADVEEARVAGGAVRNTLLGVPVTDIDIATTTLPEETARRAEAAGFKAVPTGAEHGTVTVIARGTPFEVTTLRADVETDGRRARVVFGRDWKQDAERRDFTINALYAKADGTIVDLVGGASDIDSRTIRFIGDAETRIREDYLRILRFFRFFAWYGSGRPDADGLRAGARLKEGLDQLSAERVWAELKRLLSAPDPSRALLWMRQAGVLSRILPESEKWGIDAIHGLVQAERDLGWEVDPMLRLEAMVPPAAERMEAMAERLKLSNNEAERLEKWAKAPQVRPDASERSLGQLLYASSPEGLCDRLRLALSAARWRAAQDTNALVEAGGHARLLRAAQEWARPTFPLKGADLLGLGLAKGPKVGEILKALEAEWVASGFEIERGALMKRATQMIDG
ncbi:CCA tRNA nucleotidyltransferase [Arvimicrobium flavum]|uniref:CCA tRNA nucleotidyltransferase n=1 Tax=Arvimicrobium flavum TaxID=3393320 RepID=UPI00237B972B|nr:CCA tRNA nucleotidyltransferase [Mesorhizobium shangrilense]